MRRGKVVYSGDGEILGTVSVRSILGGVLPRNHKEHVAIH